METAVTLSRCSLDNNFPVSEISLLCHNPFESEKLCKTIVEICTHIDTIVANKILNMLCGDELHRSVYFGIIFTEKQ